MLSFLSTSSPLFESLRVMHPELTALRRDLHAHPELGFEEVRTARRVADALRVCGVDEVHTGIAKTGVVGIIHGRGGATSVAAQAGGHKARGLRADMDALPMREENDFSWRSTKAGLMHGCGHDGHTTMLIGAARAPAQQVADARPQLAVALPLRVQQFGAEDGLERVVEVGTEFAIGGVLRQPPDDAGLQVDTGQV